MQHTDMDIESGISQYEIKMYSHLTFTMVLMCSNDQYTFLFK